MRQCVSFLRQKLTDHCQLPRHRRGNDGGRGKGQGDVEGSSKERQLRTYHTIVLTVVQQLHVNKSNAVPI